MRCRIKSNGSQQGYLIVPDEGATVSLDPQIVPFEKARPVVEATIMPRLAERIRRQLEEGRTISLREGSFRAWCRIAYGIFLLLLTPLLVLSIRYILIAPDVYRTAILLIRQGWRGRGGGFHLSSEGVVVDPDSEDLVSWRDVTLSCLDEAGIVMSTLEGGLFSASSRAENFPPVAAWLEARLASAPQAPS